MNKLIIIIVLLIIKTGTNVTFSQSRIVYGYDNAGNRTSKSSVMTRVGAQSRMTDAASKTDSDIRFKETDEGITIKAVNPETCTISVYTLGGVLMYRKTEQLTSTLISMKGHPKGTYIIRVEHDGKFTTYKAVK